MFINLLGFTEELPLDYQPARDSRDNRPPEFLTDRNGRRLLIDQKVLDPGRGVIPADETASRVVQIRDLRALGSVRFTTRPTGLQPEYET